MTNNKEKIIAVLFGGKSSEYEVSINSAVSILNAIETCKKDSKTPFKVIMIWISKDGMWRMYNGNIDDIAKDNPKKDALYNVAIKPNNKDFEILILDQDKIINKFKVDIVFPVFHGKNGEDGTLQGIFESASVHIIGCNTLSSALCMDKFRTKKVLESSKIPCVSGYVYNLDVDIDKNIDQAKKDVSNFDFPVFVKPSRSGSSIGVSKVDTLQELENAIREAFLFDNTVILEQGIVGKELCVSVWKRKNLGKTEFIFGDIGEIVINREGNFFDYNEKYTHENSFLQIPANIENTTKEKLYKMSKEIFDLLDCKDFVRIDFLLDKKENIYFNEVNTIPGFTPLSLFPDMLKSKYDFNTLIKNFVFDALEEK